MWIKEDVELGSWRDVALSYSSSHNNNLVELADQVRIAEQKDTKICEGPCIKPGDIRWIGFDSLVDLIEAVL